MRGPFGAIICMFSSIKFVQRALLILPNLRQVCSGSQHSEGSAKMVLHYNRVEGTIGSLARVRNTKSSKAIQLIVFKLIKQIIRHIYFTHCYYTLSTFLSTLLHSFSGCKSNSMDYKEWNGMKMWALTFQIIFGSYCN